MPLGVDGVAPEDRVAVAGGARGACGGGAIAPAGGDRVAIARAARSTRDRDAVLGRYSIDAEGHTTSTAYGRLAVVDGALVWDV